MADIAQATPSDLAAIGDLIKLLHGDDAPALTPVRQASRTFVARVDEAVAGFAICTLTDYGVSRSGQLEELAVAEAAQGAGLGRDLVRACEAWLTGEGADVLFVSVLAGAEGFYDGLGFKPCTGPWLYRSLDAANATAE